MSRLWSGQFLFGLIDNVFGADIAVVRNSNIHLGVNTVKYAYTSILIRFAFILSLYSGNAAATICSTAFDALSYQSLGSGDQEPIELSGSSPSYVLRLAKNLASAATKNANEDRRERSLMESKKEIANAADVELSDITFFAIDSQGDVSLKFSFGDSYSYTAATAELKQLASSGRTPCIDLVSGPAFLRRLSQNYLYAQRQVEDRLAHLISDIETTKQSLSEISRSPVFDIVIVENNRKVLVRFDNGAILQISL